MTTHPLPIKAHCNSCAQDTKHFIIAKRVQNGSEPYDETYDVSWTTTYEMLECCGCENVTLRRTFWFSEWNPGEVEVEHFPPAVSRRPPEWHTYLPKDIQALLKEVYTALQADSRRLAMMGTRAILDLYMVRKVGDVGGFHRKLNDLESQGFISTRNRKVVEAALDTGSAAAHRGHLPEPAQVNQVIDIVENLLQDDILESSAAALRKATPPRLRVVKQDGDGNPIDT